jgi:molybdopterin-guanine dinucleotide biosynthesis protein A
MNIEKITGVILAGGKNSRMGSDKGLLDVGGKKIIERIIEELKQAVEEIIIISNGDKYDYLGYKIYSDIIKDCGPMGGIHTALTYSITERNLIISCDMPFVSKNILKAIIEYSDKCEIAIPEHDNGTMEPLCAIYSKSCIGKFEKLLKKGEFKLKNSLKYFIVNKINFTQKKLSGNEFLNINTPEEYQTIHV